MPKLRSWQCSCERYAEFECDWPGCRKPVCSTCRRVINGFDYCPFHRGDPPQVVAAKEAAAKAEAERAGAQAAAEAAAILGLTPRDSKKLTEQTAQEDTV